MEAISQTCGTPCREADVPAQGAQKPRGGGKRRVWADPDDPLLVVPVAGQPRARRLRETEEERELTGAGAFHPRPKTPTVPLPTDSDPGANIIRPPKAK